MVTTHAGRVDACPGILTLHDAADGPLARVRVPGGLLSAAALEILAVLIDECAGGWLELTSRGNLGIRSVSAPAELRDGLAVAGLLVSDGAHDHARNIIASPLTGLVPGPDARPLVTALDAGLLDSEALGGLSGRFLLGVDDGSGLAETPDLGLAFAGDTWQLTIDGHRAGAAGVGDVLAAAERFLVLRGGDLGSWRVRDLPGGATLFGRPLGARRSPVAGRLPLGWHAEGVLVVAGWLQRVSPAQLRALAAVLTPGDQVRVTAAGRLVVPSQTSTAAALLAATGLVVEAGDPRAEVTACSGLGACARATVDVRTLAATLAVPGVAPVHVVSCSRACGTPHDAKVDVRA